MTERSSSFALEKKKTSLTPCRGSGPPPPQPPSEWGHRLQCNTCARALHRRKKKCIVVFLMTSGSDLALVATSPAKNWRDSDQRPPTSQPKTSTVWLSQLGVRPLFAPPSLVQGCSTGGGTLVPGCPVTPDCRHHGGVDGQLRPPEQGEAINHHFQPAVVEMTERKEVHVLDSDVGRDPSPCLPADANCCALQRKSSAAQHPCQRTRCTVVATRVKWTATPAGERRQGQSLPKTSEEKHPELLRLERRFRRDRQASVRETCHVGNGEGPAPGVRVSARSTEPGNFFPPREKSSAATHACLLGCGWPWDQNLGGLHVPSPPTQGLRIPNQRGSLGNELQLPCAVRLHLCSEPQ